jgi:type III secretion protein C
MTRTSLLSLFNRTLRYGTWFVMGSVLAQSAQAVPLTLTGSDYFVSSRGMRVDALLKDFGANYRVPVVVSPLVDDTFVGTLRNLSPRALLDRVAETYNLAWYFDGKSLYVYKASETRTKLLAPKHLSVDELKQALQQSHAFDSPYCSIRAVAHFNTLEVQGVPSCVDYVTQLSDKLDERLLAQAKTEEAVRVFPLRYASASPASYTYRDQQVTIPGVVDELREMSQNRSMPVKGDGGQVQKDEESGSGLPIFSADARQNAVIVRDRKANMMIYESLIQQLDVRPEQIEVAVTIIDVDERNIRNLGIDFGGAMNLGGGSFSFNNEGKGEGAAGFSTLLPNAGEFFVRVHALEEISKAKVLSRPSVVTLNNVQAVLDRNTTFYTKLQGEYVAELASVAAGTLMRVTPRLIDAKGHQEVMLTLDIQDGRQDPVINSKEAIPAIHNSGITTQAVLKAGQSLVLGGFVQTRDRDGERKIPWLSDLPFIGKLFSSEGRDQHRVMRLFVIRAQPISLHGDVNHGK